ncbi:MAG: hypothetical protein M1587_11985 [Thaumarchaeota archaeon]|nr:hypothetical protein [Nitrososphaerota archaeon]
MKNQFLAGSALLSASPGVALLVLGHGGLVELISIVMISIAAMMIPAGLLTSSGVTKLAWLEIALILSVLVMSTGYVSITFGYPLVLSSNLVMILALLCPLSEVGIVLSSMFGNYRNYSVELSNSGYEKREFDEELRSFDKFMLTLVLCSGAAAFGSYLVLAYAPRIAIDSLTALVIGVVVYLVIARFLIYQGKK